MDVLFNLSDQQKSILAMAVRDGSFHARTPAETKRIRQLHEKGLVCRRAGDVNACDATGEGRAAAVTLGIGGGVSSPSPSVVVVGEAAGVAPDASGLVATVERARALLDDGDVINARIVAGVAYAHAQANVQFAEKVGATEQLIAKAQRLQHDALLIESRAKIIIAKHRDAAREAGEVSKGGRPKPVPDGNGLTAADTGLSRKEIHEARKMAQAEDREPGIVERAIAERLAQGLAPTRASLRSNLRVSIGTKTATKEERGNNLYETPVEGTWTILALEDFSPTVSEPFCGRGAIARVLERAGYEVVLSDLVDYGTATKDGELQAVGDFLDSKGPNFDIVSNPPYGDTMNACIAHALRVLQPAKMALLLNINVQCGFEDPDRTYYMETCPPARIYVNKHRLPMMHRDGWTGPEASSSMNTMWCVWERQVDGTYGDTTILKRVDYADYQPQENAE